HTRFSRDWSSDVCSSDLDAVGIRLKAFEMKPFSAAKTTAEDLRNMGLLDLATYQGLQAADALRDAARNEGGIAGAGVGLGAGMRSEERRVGIEGKRATQP